jgi:hypothetical protein
MADTTAAQSPVDVVSPTLRANFPASSGHYTIQHTWRFDATTNIPLGVTQTVVPG